MSPIKVRRIAHVVLYVADPEASAAWYCDILGMTLVARVADGPYKGGIFLSFGEQDHDIALFKSDPAATKGREFEHIGLELASHSMDDLRRTYALFKKRNVRIHEVLDHGVSVGIYFYDPDGHLLEVFHQKIAAEGGEAIAELAANEGMAEPFDLEPLHD